MKKVSHFILGILLTFAICFPILSQDNLSEGNNPNTLSPVNIQSPNFDGPKPPTPQALITVLPGNGSTSGNGRAPQGSRLFINSKYLITGAEMTASGFGATTVTSIGWEWNNPTGAGAPVAQSVPTTGNLKVFLKDTLAGATAVGSTFIDTNNTTGGYVKIIDGTISIPATLSQIDIDVPVGGPGTAPFTPTAGNGVLVIFVYTTTTPLATPLGAPTVFCTNVGSIVTYQSQTTPGNIGTASTFRPQTRFGNTEVDVYAISNVYALGKVPTPWGCPDTLCYRLRRLIPNPLPIQVQVRIINLKPNPGNLKFDTTIIFNRPDGLPFDTILPFVRPWNIQGWKLDSIIIEAIPKPGETVIANNHISWRQQITCDAWNWAQVNQPPDGGVGFTGGVGTFVACFRNNCPIPLPLWAVDLCFFNLVAAGNQPYRVYVFGDGGGGSPGPIIFRSEMLTSPPGTATPPQRVQYAFPTPVIIPPNSRFYVGVVQKGIVNLGYCFQNENPVKTKRFFFTVDTSGVAPIWTDFGPTAAPFRLDICPRTVTRLFLRAFLEGFFNGTTQVPDTVITEVRSQNPPYQLVDVSKAVLNANGFGTFQYCRIECDSNYFFVCRHRNHIRTWSHAQPENFNQCDRPYDFTDNITKAFGNNMKFISGDNNGVGGFTFFVGDVNQDGIVDGSDLSLIFNLAKSSGGGSVGYVPEDLNYDDACDVTDISLCFNNLKNEVAEKCPTCPP